MIIVLFNVYIDSANIFSSSNAEKAAKIIEDGKNVANIYNLDDRNFIQELINKKINNHTIVIGSSRHMQIGDSQWMSSLFNYSVTGAAMQDFFGIVELLDENDIFPDTIIFGIDPWLFNKNNKASNWVSIETKYFTLVDKLKIDPIDVNVEKKYKRIGKEILNPKYFYENINVFFNNRKLDVYPTTEKYLDINVKLNDGSLIYGISERNQTENEINSKADMAALNMEKLKNYDQLDSLHIVHFEKLVEFFQSKKTEVIIFLTPFHPNVWNTFYNNEKFIMVFKVEEYIRKYAAENCLTIIGTYDPYPLNMQQFDFYDGIHPKREVMNQIISYKSKKE